MYRRAEAERGKKIATYSTRRHLLVAKGSTATKDEVHRMRWLTTPLQSDADVVTATSRLHAWAGALGLDALVRARVVTLGGELARAAASSGDGSIEFGWSADSGRPWCAIEAPVGAIDASAAHIASEAQRLADLDVARSREGERARVRLVGRSNASRESVERAVEDAAGATTVDVLAAQNLELARMLGTLRDRESDLVHALEDARKSANEAAAHAMRAEELSKKKDELLAIASHDIRSPLAATKGALDLLEPSLRALSDDQKQLFGVARRGCDSVLHLLGNLLSTALVDLPDDDAESDPSTFELVATTRAVLELLAVPARQKGVEIECDAPPSVAVVRGDPTWARQIATNLVNNALKYAPKQGGRVVVRIEERGGEVRLSVTDNGVGIPPEAIDRVFDKLAKLRPRGTAGERGTGIGLYVTKKLVERMGGGITVHARDGGGASFAVRFPITRRAAPQLSARE